MLDRIVLLVVQERGNTSVCDLAGVGISSMG